MLKECGDTFELARAPADLSQAFQRVGDQHNARRPARRAWRVAKPSGAQALCLEVDPEGGNGSGASPARQTYTAASISEQLSITASTVEQHLTRGVRKLNVKRCQELP